MHDLHKKACEHAQNKVCAGAHAGILQQLLTADYRIRPHDLERSCHCLHPAFLSASLYASLNNLGLQTVRWPCFPFSSLTVLHAACNED